MRATYQDLNEPDFTNVAGGRYPQFSEELTQKTEELSHII
jgi:hypothetical protein